MVKANLKETIEKIRRGETTPRKYPNRETEIKYTEDKRKMLQEGEPNLMQPRNKGIALVIAGVSPENYDKIVKERDDEKANDKGVDQENQLKVKTKEVYTLINEVLNYYIDLPEEKRNIVSLWIIGTYLHSSFTTYPYLFFNAMKGSGKTRLLMLIKELSCEGDMLASLTEAVLFRTRGTLCIDELENIGNKDKNALRELLNTAYKRGGKVKRMKKKKTPEGEQQVVEEFNTFRPIVMANIKGMEEVLGDRCITLILEKSNKARIIRKMETFEEDEKIQEIKQKFALITNLVGLVGRDRVKKTYKGWNIYVELINHLNLYNIIPTNTTTPTEIQQNLNEDSVNLPEKFALSNLNLLEVTPTSSYSPYFDEKTLNLYDKLYKTNIDGRNLELSFPLILIAENLELLDFILGILKKIMLEKRENELMESKDILLFGFIARQQPREWYKIKELTNAFRLGLDEDSEEEKWINGRWLGRALKRLNLTLEKRIVQGYAEVILNIDKAKEKMEMFQ